MNFSEALLEELIEDGYTHCFFVAGGNIMHLLNAARSRFNCIPVIHEVTAVIAAEYFNEINDSNKAFALVTAGPGITNCITGIAGSWLESRFVLIIGGQVKSVDLSDSNLRQRGIQEIDGVNITSGISKASLRIDSLVNVDEILKVLKCGEYGRPGPVFLEICLDIQASEYPTTQSRYELSSMFIPDSKQVLESKISEIVDLFAVSTRPIILIGGGVSRKYRKKLSKLLEELEIPTMTTWNASDRISSDAKNYFGRPNTWGQRYANVIIQQSDLLIAVGTRLGLQQTGFNWESFAPLASIVQVDIDESELTKGHPRVNFAICADASVWISKLLSSLNKTHVKNKSNWVNFSQEVKNLLPLSENSNSAHEGFANPYEFIEALSLTVDHDSILIPCSSGGAFTVFMQTFEQTNSQIIVSNKGLASMGYGLAGAIGASFSEPHRQVILVEGDGGFSQNLQELATVNINKLPIKIILFSNGGYASIRMTQKNYFGGTYIGCDYESGLGMPDWKMLFTSYGIKNFSFDPKLDFKKQLKEFFEHSGPGVMLIPIHPEQTYFPKITSKLTSSGEMLSNPLHLMSPMLDEQTSSKVFQYLEEMK